MDERITKQGRGRMGLTSRKFSTINEGAFADLFTLPLCFVSLPSIGYE
jgi:hypothetical protein